MSAPTVVDALAPGGWPAFALVSARMVGLVLVAPLWSMTGVPRSVRGAIVVVCTLAVLPTVRAAALPTDYIALVVPLATELLIGLAIGLVGAVFMAGIAMAGEVAALQMGLNLGPALSPSAEGTVTGVGELSSMLALALYATLGGHMVLLAAVADSFRAIPPGGAVDVARGSDALVTLAGGIVPVAVRAAAPMIAALLLANFALAILSRAVPQLNAMAIAFPVTIGLGLIVLGATLTVTGTFIGEAVTGLPRTAAETIEFLRFEPAR